MPSSLPQAVSIGNHDQHGIEVPIRPIGNDHPGLDSGPEVVNRLCTDSFPRNDDRGPGRIGSDCSAAMRPTDSEAGRWASAGLHRRTDERVRCSV